MNPVLDRLPILILFPHSRCNCRCVMCDIWKVDTIEQLSIEDLERHASDIERLRVEWVVFSGGEPLMHSDLFRLADFLHARRIRTSILSSGLLLERYASRIAECVDDVIVSLDGPRDVHDRIRGVTRAFDMLASGISAIRRESPNYPISARCTVQRENFKSLRQTIRAAREIGLDSISFLAADVTTTAFNRPVSWPEQKISAVALNAGEISELESEIEAVISENEGFVLESPEKLRRIVQHFRAQAGLVDPEAPRCNAPWVSAVVESSGMVRPCFFHAPIGNTRIESLIDAINGPSAVEFRGTLDVASNPICRRCVCSLWRDGA